jgi:hypothetical protein
MEDPIRWLCRVLKIQYILIISRDYWIVFNFEIKMLKALLTTFSLLPVTLSCYYSYYKDLKISANIKIASFFLEILRDIARVLGKVEFFLPFLSYVYLKYMITQHWSAHRVKE